jgi:hypothetical protein
MSSLDLANQTGLIPQQFYGVNNAGTQSVQIDSNGISLQNTALSKTLGVGAGGWLVNGTYTIDPLNLTAICANPTPTGLNVCNTISLQSTITSPNQTITIEAGNPANVGDIFGLNYYDASLNNFSIQTTAGQGGVIFKEFGAGASANTARIKQGVITLTDGTTTNTLSNTDWTGTIKTANTTANLTHYLNFSDSSSTGQGNPQKTTGISCNPSTNTITATTFSGTASSATNATNVGITADNTSGTYYLPFAKTSGTGNKPLFIDDTTTPLTYNPSTGELTATTFTGSFNGSITTATNATNVGITSDNTSGTYYIPFVKTSGSGNKPLYIDDTTTTLSYNPSTATMTTTSYVASGSGSTNTIGASSMVVSNAGGTLTINQGAVSATTSTFSVNAGTLLQLQVASSTLVGLNTTALTTYKPIYLDDNNSHQSILNANWFSTASVNSTNIYNPASIIKELNIGALGSGGTITKYPFSTIRNYATNTYFYTSAIDTTPLLITGNDTYKTISVVGTTGNVNYSQSNQTYNSGNSNGGIYENRNTGTNVAGNLPIYQLYSTFPTPAGANYSNGYFYMKGSCVNMLTTYNPSGTENSYNLGFQSNINTCVDMFVNPDTSSGVSTTPTILRVSENSLTYGLGTSGNYAFGDTNPTTFGSTYFTINGSGITTPTTLQLPTTSTSVSFSGSITFNAQSKTFPAFYINATGTTNTITGYSFINYPLNGVAQVAIYNGGSGNLTFNKVAGIRANFSSTFVVPAGGYANMTIKYLYYGTASYYSLEATNYTT